MRYKYILFLLLAACFSIAQAQVVKQVTIIDDLETPVPGEGVIQINSNPKITELIGLVSPGTSIDETNNTISNGFRVQVFMSNNAKTAIKEIADKGNLIKGTFPDIAVYKGYEPPNWKLLVGDFVTREEANFFRQKLQKSIPELGKEMSIVKSKINISGQKNN